MKKILILLSLLPSEMFARRFGGRYEGALPKSDEVINFTLFAIGFIVAGVIFFKASSLLKAKNNKSESLGTFGCIGTIFFVAAGICSIPILLWISEIVNSILSLVIISVAILISISLIYSWLINKKL